MKKYSLLLMMVFSVLSIHAQKHDSDKEQDEAAFGRNNISIMLSDVVLKRVSFEYEHIFGDEGNMSINIPFSIAIGEADDVYGDQVNWWGGLGMKLYPTGQGKIRYFVGPEVRVISAHYEGIDYSYYDGYTEEKDVKEEYIHTAFLLNNGFIYEPTKNFIFSVNLGVGFMSRDQKTGDGVQPMATPSVRMGFRF
ncbi:MULTISPECIES: hypothetical protein [unclassified Lentimicrobium]|uniref:hypothetical protein n=1 Tax=unclassified Lentimicrobium TaxID=2677434 RepID=UPI0015530787|nr:MULTISPECIES: hypothetical protein [unclassified Lentimicrobium]NPD47131.1 hypothetical protein [Lentimicrobium sp. S6]NPD83772.1 hypothetical protein [Lentimicrobium sp. L6]